MKQVLVKSFCASAIFEQQDAGESLACILDELCGNFILVLDLVRVKTRVIAENCLSCHLIIENENSFTSFIRVANTVQSSLDLFLKPENL